MALYVTTWRETWQPYSLVSISILSLRVGVLDSELATNRIEIGDLTYKR
jgi:hypothetical protein